MQEEKKCPKCANGTLAKMTDKELAKAGVWERVLRTGEIILGCDECKHMEDSEGYPVFDVTRISVKTSELINDQIRKVKITLNLHIIKDNEKELEEDIAILIKKFNF